VKKLVITMLCLCLWCTSAWSATSNYTVTLKAMLSDQAATLYVLEDHYDHDILQGGQYYGGECDDTPTTNHALYDVTVITP
jgi:hypothetical protein